MIETKIEWDGDKGTIVEDGTIEIAARQAIEEAKPLADKLLEIARRHGVSMEITAEDYIDMKDEVTEYRTVGAHHVKGKMNHVVNQFRFGNGDYIENAYVFDKSNSEWKDSPREARVVEVKE